MKYILYVYMLQKEKQIYLNTGKLRFDLVKTVTAIFEETISKEVLCPLVLYYQILLHLLSYNAYYYALTLYSNIRTYY